MKTILKLSTFALLFVIFVPAFAMNGNLKSHHKIQKFRMKGKSGPTYYTVAFEVIDIQTDINDPTMEDYELMAFLQDDSGDTIRHDDDYTTIDFGVLLPTSSSVTAMTIPIHEGDAQWHFLSPSGYALPPNFFNSITLTNSGGSGNPITYDGAELDANTYATYL